MRLKASLIVPVAALTLGFGLLVASPMNAAHAQQEQIYGRELITERERSELQARMRAATSAEEREQIRWEHHIRMQERAKERGVVLPDEAPMFGMRQRPGQDGGQRQLRLPKGGGGRRGG